MEKPVGGFATGRIQLGELDLVQIWSLERIWSFQEGKSNLSVSFYRAVGIPAGYFSTGCICESTSKKGTRAWIIAVKDISAKVNSRFPSLARPVGFTLVWSSQNYRANRDGNSTDNGYFWLPKAPDGYRPCGFVVTATASKPSLDEVRCVRYDLTETGEADRLIFTTGKSNPSGSSFCVWNVRPKIRGATAKGVSLGTFYCNNCLNIENPLPVSCLSNANWNLSGMPNLYQMHSLMKQYGPVVIFHPDETFFPSSVSWLFGQGQLLYKKGNEVPQKIESDGSNLPQGGSNDKEYWLDFPTDEGLAKRIKKGDLESAVAYVHFKPALGATFTDIVIWIFYPFNGPVTVKVGAINLPLKIGEHVGDWEHFTLRVSNFTGELWKIYFSQHRGGQWIDVSDLEFTEGNRILVYATKGGHAVFPQSGNHLEGDRKLGIGIRNDACRSKYFMDTSKKYEIIAAEYLEQLDTKDVVVEPHWLQYMRQWGPNTTYNSRAEFNRVFRLLPSKIRSPIERLLNKLPKELSGEQGPTGPKAKDNWYGDERG